MKNIILMLILFISILSGCGSEEDQPPSVPNLPYPANGDSGISVDTELSWKCKDPDGDSVIYNIYIQDENEETYLTFEDQSKRVIQVKGLKYDTSYRWRVIARDNKNNVTEGPTWMFTTEKYIPPSTEERVLVNETARVAPGEFLTWKFSLLKGSKIHGEISSDSAINMWMMSMSEFDKFSKWENFSPYAEASRKQVLQFTFDHNAPESGEYYFVLDNRSSLFTSRTVSVYIKTVYQGL